MIDLQDMVVKSLRGYDSSRSRSTQVEIGPSSLGGCSRRVWHDLKQTEKINQTETLGAILGTFIHSGMEKAMQRLDPFGDNFLIEIELNHPEIKGHCDLFIKDLGLVVDFKTKTKSSMRYLGKDQEQWQIQVYGWLLEQQGYEVRSVALVGIPRDGKMTDIKIWQDEYKPHVAQEALQWLRDLKAWAASDEAPPQPQLAVSFCKDYCPYFDPSGEIGCPSTMK
jgi:hypothetical protein